MRVLRALVRRNNKIFFKDKGLFFTSLATPLILFVLYLTFLANVYRNAFVSSMPEGLELGDSLVRGLVGGQLVSSLLAVCTVTVSFCSNLLMVHDKSSGAYRDISVSPAKKSTVSLAYFLSSASVTLIVSLVALFAGLIYLAFVGWYLSFLDVLLLIFDVVLLTLFGTAVSSVINSNLSTSGQASAMGSIVSSCYGFLCGAYMPISNFPQAMQNVVTFLPGTYGTSLLRTHALSGVFAKMQENGLNDEILSKIKDSTDCNIHFFGTRVSNVASYFVLIGAVLVFTLGYVLLCNLKNSKARR